MIDRITLPKAVKDIITELNKGGYEAYIVGGCVRDAILGKAPKDWDITTSALPQQVKEIFPHTYDTGIEHGTVTVLIDKVGYEVTTYRIDGEYKDNRHPESVVFTSDLVGDLARRDFTMNAIAYNEAEGFVDEFGGIEDMSHRLIRAVREPSERFREDGLRMMRALRFSAQLGFTIEERTRQAVAENAHLIKNISMERIRDELFKLILSEHPLNIYEVRDAGLMDYFMPEMSRLIEENRELIGRCMEVCRGDIVCRLALIFYTMDSKHIEGLLKRLRMDNKTLKEVVVLSRYMLLSPDVTPYGVRSLINRVGAEMAERVIYMWGLMGHTRESDECQGLLTEVVTRGDCCTMGELALTGEDLIEMGIPRGKVLGDMLRAALEEVLHNPENNNKEYLKRFVSDIMGGN